MGRKKTLHRPDTRERTHYIPSKDIDLSLHPRLLYAGVLECSPRWNETPHNHPFLEVIFVNSGAGQVCVEGKTFQVKKGDLIVYNAGVSHSEISSPDDPLGVYFFAAQNIGLMSLPENALVPAGAEAVIATGGEFDAFHFYFSALVRESRSAAHFSKEITDSLTRLLLLQLLRLLPYDSARHLPAGGLYAEAKNYINRYYTSINSVNDICGRLKVSQFYLTHLFKRCGDKPPLQCVIQKRLELAKSLLASTDLPVQDIALRCGYDEEYSLYRVFKKREQTTPKQYRQDHEKAGKI